MLIVYFCMSIKLPKLPTHPVDRLLFAITLASVVFLTLFLEPYEPICMRRLLGGCNYVYSQKNMIIAWLLPVAGYYVALWVRHGFTKGG